MKSLIYLSAKTLLLLTFVLLINVSGFAQKKKVVTPKKTVEAKKVVEVVNPDKRPVAVYLKDGNELKGTFVDASSEGIQILILENTLSLKWKEIKQIFFIDDNKEIITKNSDSQYLAEVEINKKPLQDFIVFYKDKVQSNQIDLKKPFLVVMDGYLTKDGKLDRAKSRFVKSEGDEEIIVIAKDGIAALDDSGWFGYLKQYGVDNINFTLQQNENEIKVVILSDQRAEERAKTVSSAFGYLISFVLLAEKNGLKKLGDDERTLLNNMKVTSNGKQFILTIALPKSVAQELINRKI